MQVKTPDQLSTLMKSIMHRWHYSTRVGNDGDPGNTLEDLLGIPENNFKLPDFGDVELKTRKYEGAVPLITLFHKEPTPSASVPKLLKAMGWKHTEAGNKYPEDEMSFRSTTYGHRFSTRGFTIDVEDKRINFVYDSEKVDRSSKDRTSTFENYGEWSDDVEKRSDPHYSQVLPVYYEIDDLIKSFKTKLNHTLLALHKSRTHQGKKQYWYEEAYLMKEVRSEMIVPLIQEGALAIDFDARTRHNHGTKLRIKKDKAASLFTDFRLME